MTKPIRKIILLLAAALALTTALAACGSDDASSTAATGTESSSADSTAKESTTASTAATTTASTKPASALEGDLTVFAAASLTDAFDEIGAAFMTANPDATVTFSYAGSSDLVTQINEGAPADVFASADKSNMTKLTDAGNGTGTPVVFAKNTPQIIVGAGNPKAIAAVADLAKADNIVVICAPEVPCGKYAATILSNAKVTVTPKSLEQNVKAVVSKVTAGEADAGIVYATDVLAAGDKAEGVDIPAEVNVIAEYPIVATTASANPEAAAAFIEFVSSEQGQKILDSYGFLKP
jgi:molybdate transport system substrate-binding protein